MVKIPRNDEKIVRNFSSDCFEQTFQLLFMFSFLYFSLILPVSKSERKKQKKFEYFEKFIRVNFEVYENYSNKYALHRAKY